MADQDPSPYQSDSDRTPPVNRSQSSRFYLRINGVPIELPGMSPPMGLVIGIVGAAIAIPMIYATYFAPKTATSESAVSASPAITTTVNASSTLGTDSNSDIDPLGAADAIAAYTEAIRLNPSDRDAYRARGLLYADLGDFDKALADLEEVVRLSPDDPLGYINRGSAKFNLGDTAGAIADYETAASLGSRDDLLYFNRALAKAQLGDIEGAIADYTTLLIATGDTEDGNSKLQAQALANRGVLKSNQEDWAGAIADLDRAIELDPNNPSFLFDRGLAKDFQGDYDGAGADYSATIRLEPTHAGAYALRGGIHSAAEDYETAIADFTTAISLEPENANNYSSRALAYEFEGNFAAALADYDEAIRLDPTIADVFYGRGMVKDELNDEAGAIADLRQAAELFQQQGDIETYEEVIDYLQLF